MLLLSHSKLQLRNTMLLFPDSNRYISTVMSRDYLTVLVKLSEASHARHADDHTMAERNTA